MYIAASDNIIRPPENMGRLRNARRFVAVHCRKYLLLFLDLVE